MLEIWVLVTALVSLILVYPSYMNWKSPKNSPTEFLRSGNIRSLQKVVVLLGDSITKGRISADYVQLLSKDLEENRFNLINAGVNGDLAWHVLQRLDEVIQCNPDIVTILIGTNDANSTRMGMHRSPATAFRKLPRIPDIDWFEANLKEIVHRLAESTKARIALLSIPPLGEDLDSYAVALSSQFSETIREIALQTNTAYLPLHEKMLKFIRNNPSRPKKPIETSFWWIFASLYWHYLFRGSWNSISAQRGFRLLNDHIHLNDDAAMMVADMIRDFILEEPT
ncbi:MAG: SGNH/GDSL hydrolase family protein [Promethearchaeota archaeon]